MYYYSKKHIHDTSAHYSIPLARIFVTTKLFIPWMRVSIIGSRDMDLMYSKSCTLLRQERQLGCLCLYVRLIIKRLSVFIYAIAKDKLCRYFRIHLQEIRHVRYFGINYIIYWVEEAKYNIVTSVGWCYIERESYNLR